MHCVGMFAYMYNLLYSCSCRTCTSILQHVKFLYNHNNNNQSAQYIYHTCTNEAIIRTRSTETQLVSTFVKLHQLYEKYTKCV